MEEEKIIIRIVDVWNIVDGLVHIQNRRHTIVLNNWESNVFRSIDGNSNFKQICDYLKCNEKEIDEKEVYALIEKFFDHGFIAYDEEDW